MTLALRTRTDVKLGDDRHDLAKFEAAIVTQWMTTSSGKELNEDEDEVGANQASRKTFPLFATFFLLWQHKKDEVQIDRVIDFGSINDVISCRLTEIMTSRVAF